MTIALESMAVEIPEVAGHPNRAEFRGVLATVDAASQRAPSGAKGHLVLLTRAAAEAALPSLLGMALDYAPSLDRHDVQRKIGVITRAEIVGRSIEVGGYLFARDFPDIVEEIGESGRHENRGAFKSGQKRASGVSSTGLMGRMFGFSGSAQRTSARWARGSKRIHANAYEGLGMSYEVTDVRVNDTTARIWILSRVTFTGAAVLRRDKAAYSNTWIELG
ncbi:MAG TPA: hypothetical protein VFO39_19400 [Candidatus Sulfotelmatobacter sp.]|nr:hypothetical protein [Candidatus Sulfotelmatobacter sp.]